MSQLSPTANTTQLHAQGYVPYGASQTTPPKTQSSEAQQGSQPQQSPEVQAKLAAIYAEAETEHWSESQTNQAITKALQEYGTTSTAETSSSANDETSLIDFSA